MRRRSQLVLPFGHQPSRVRGDFVSGAANRLAFDSIDGWPDSWPSRTLVLVGEAGSGKSHLAAIWSRRANACLLDRDHLDAQALDSFPAGAAFVLEDAAPVADERGLFHVLNRVSERRQWLLVTSRMEPGLWGVVLPDLRSRLQSAPQVAIAQPDDELLRAIMVKLLSDRQIEAEATTLRFLIERMERSPAAACRLVARLDEIALTDSRRMITRAMAIRALEAEKSSVDGA